MGAREGNAAMLYWLRGGIMIEFKECI
jgi:hypothetical protein